MSANNAIASGSVILSANADGLLTGLDRAEKAVGKWAGDVDRKVSTIGAGIARHWGA